MLIFGIGMAMVFLKAPIDGTELNDGRKLARLLNMDRLGRPCLK